MPSLNGFFFLICGAGNRTQSLTHARQVQENSIENYPHTCSLFCKIKLRKLGMVAYAYNPSTWEVEAGGFSV
jgi:hypothetical protein